VTTQKQIDMRTAIVLRKRLLRYWATAGDWKNELEDRDGHDCFIVFAASHRGMNRVVASDAYRAMSFTPRPRQQALAYLNRKIFTLKRGHASRTRLRIRLSMRLLSRRITRLVTTSVGHGSLLRDGYSAG